MDVRKHKAFLKAISIIVVVCFLSLDVAWAYPVSDIPSAGSQKLAGELPFQQDLMSMQRQEFQESLFSDMKLLLSVNSVAKFLLDDDLPLKYLDRVLTEELGEVAEGIDLSKVKISGGVILIPYNTAEKRYILQIARKDDLSARELMGYQWVIGDKYVITALPEDYQESPQTEAKPQKEEPKVEISEPVAEIEYETKVELTREEPSKKKLIIRAIIAASLLILLTPLSAFAGTGAMASTLGALDGTELAFLGIAGALAAFFAFWFWLTRRVTMPASWWLKKLKSDDKMARREAVECLGKWKHYNNEEVINALINALENDDDPGVRARAAKALGVIANKRALDAVTKAKNDKDPLVAIHAERAWHELMDNAKVKEREDYFAPLRKPHKGFGQLLFGVAFLSLVLPLILHLILNDIGTSFFIGVIAALIFIPFGGILLDIKNNVDAIKDFRTEPVEASEPMKFEDKGTPPKGPSLKILIPAGYDGEAYKRSEEKERLRILETLKKEKTGQKDFPGFLTWALAEERSFSKEGMDTSYIQGVILKAIGQETLWHPRDKELYGEVKGVLINLLREEYGSINKLTAEDKLPSNVEYSTVSRFAVQELMRLYLAFEKGLHLSEEEESVLVAESRPALLVLTTLMAKDPPVDAILDLVAAGLVTGWGLKGPEIKEEHDYKAQDGFKAARISAGLYILSVIGALLLLYLNGGNITGGVIGVLAPGLYAGMAAWKYFMVGEHVQVKMEQFLRRNFEGQREGDIIVKAAGMMMNMSLSAEDRKGFYDFISKYQGRDDFKERFIKYLSKKLPVANSDGYRNLVFEELPASVQRAINIHEKFRSHFRGMISLLPVIYLFQKTPGENVKSIFKARAIGLWSSTKEAEENRLGEYDSDEYDADVYVHGKPGEVNWRLAKTAVTSPEELEVAIEILNENISIARDLTAPKGSYYGPNSFKGSVSASINMENVVSLLNDPEKLRGLIPERLQEKRRLQQPQPERPEGINLSGMMFAAVLAMERPWDYSWVNHVNWVLYAQVVAISIFFILSGTFAVVWSDEYESSKNTMIRRIVDRVRFANWYSRADAFLEGNFIVHLVAVLLFAFCMGVIFWLSPVLSLLEIILIKAPTRLFNYTDAHLFRLPRLGHVLALRVKWMGRRKNIKGLIRSLTSRMEPVKKTAISQLAKLGADPKVEKELIEALKAGEPHTAFYLAIVLGRMKSKKAIEPLIEIMENKYGKFYVRHSAAVALGQTDDPKVIDPLLDMLSVEGLSIARLERVRSGVVKALARFDGPIVKPAHKAKVRAYVEKLFNDCTLCDGQHKQSAAKKRFLGDEKKKAIIDGLCKTVHDFKDIEKVEDLLHQVVHVTFHWSRYGSSIRISKSMYEDDLRIKEILDPKNQNIEYGRSGDIMISVTCDMDRLAEIVKEATAREDAAREEAAEGSEEQEGSTHDLGVKDSYNASRITGVLSAVGFATSVAYYYLAQSPVIGIVIGAAAFGLYWGWAAVRYYRVYKTTYEEMRRKLPRAEAFKATIARNDGYRDDFIRKPGFPRKVEDLMNIHESFGSHFWGMIAMLPLVSLFCKGRARKAMKKTLLYFENYDGARSTDIGCLYQAATCQFPDVRQLALENIAALEDVDKLVKILQIGTNDKPRIAAIRQLIRLNISSPKAELALRGLLGSRNSRELRELAVQALSNVDTLGAKVFVHLYKSEDDELMKLNKKEDIVPILNLALAHDNKGIRHIAVNVLAVLKDKRSVQLLINLLKTEKDIQLATIVVELLGELGDKAADKPLTELLREGRIISGRPDSERAMGRFPKAPFLLAHGRRPGRIEQVLLKALLKIKSGQDLGAFRVDIENHVRFLLDDHTIYNGRTVEMAVKDKTVRESLPEDVYKSIITRLTDFAIRGRSIEGIETIISDCIEVDYEKGRIEPEQGYWEATGEMIPDSSYTYEKPEKRWVQTALAVVHPGHYRAVFDSERFEGIMVKDFNEKLVLPGTSDKESRPADLEAPEESITARPLFEELEGFVNNNMARLIGEGNKVIAFLNERGTIEVEYFYEGNGVFETTQRMKWAVYELERLKKVMKNFEVPERIQAAAEEVSKNLDLFEADGIVSTVITLARKAKREGKNLVIGLETDWVPGLEKGNLQHTAITPLINEIRSMQDTLRSMGLDNIVLVHESGEKLAESILAEAEKVSEDPSGLDFSNMVVLASKKTIDSYDFKKMREAGKDKKALLAAIDPTEIQKYYDEYGENFDKQLDMRVTEMLTIALDLAIGKRRPTSREWLNINYDATSRMVLFLPKAEPVKYDDLQKRYRHKVLALKAA